MPAYKIIEVNLQKIIDWDGFHELFASVFGFPDFYGRNMDAWIDCMSSLDTPDNGMTKIHVAKGGFLVLALSGVSELRRQCPEICDAIIECTAFVNYRRIQAGEAPLLMLSFWNGNE